MLTRIVLTGGPCAGKSTILKRIVQRYSQLGYAVYTLPESATLFILAGADFLTPDPHISFVTEAAKLKFQLQMEDSMAEIAEATGKPAIIVGDRGTMDTFAYVSEETRRKILEAVGLTEHNLRDGRYDAVLHICTAAKGAEQFYTLANNTCRSESIEKARSVDDHILAVWHQHPSFHVINAEIDFEVKIRNVLDTIDTILSEIK